MPELENTYENRLRVAEAAVENMDINTVKFLARIFLNDKYADNDEMFNRDAKDFLNTYHHWGEGIEERLKVKRSIND